MRLGDKLHNYRVSKNLTVQEFAEKLNTSVDVVEAWESYAKLPSVDELVKIEQTYGLSVEQLLSEDPIAAQPQPQPVQQPVYAQPQPQPVQQPVYAQPRPQPVQQPVYAQPGQPVQQPVYAQPGQPVQQPVYVQPVYRPVYQPVYAQTHAYGQQYIKLEKLPEMPTGLKAFSWISFGVAIAAFVLGFIIMASLYDYYQMYYNMGTAWIGLIAILFQQPAIVTFIIGKAKGYDTSKRNLVIGIVFTSILLFFSLVFVYDPEYTYSTGDPSLSIALSALLR